MKQKIYWNSDEVDDFIADGHSNEIVVYSIKKHKKNNIRIEALINIYAKNGSVYSSHINLSLVSNKKVMVFKPLHYAKESS